MPNLNSCYFFYYHQDVLFHADLMDDLEDIFLLPTYEQGMIF